MKRNDGDQQRADFERVSLDDLVGSSASFAEQVRRSRDVLEGGSLVRRMREMADEGAGISQEELARRLGLSQARISAIERGGGPQGPTYELLKRVARACGLVLQPKLVPSGDEDVGRLRLQEESVRPVEATDHMLPEGGVGDYFLPASALRGALRRAMDSMFRDIARMHPPGSLLQTPAAPAGAAAPRIEIDETEAEVRVGAALPGVEPEDVEVTLSEDLLTIRAVRRRDPEKMEVVVEGPTGSFVRSIRLPFRADPDTTAANFRQGLLSIAVRKPPEVLARARRIAVGSSKRAASEE